VKDKILEKKNLARLIEHLREKYEVVGPKKKEDVFIFDYIHGDEIRLDYPTTILPPKKLFFPQREPLYSYEKKNGEVALKDLMKKWTKKHLLIGIHPCDVMGLFILDKEFGGDFKDPYYLYQRQNTVMICLICKEPTEHCFCDVMNTGPTIEEGYDLLMVDIGDRYYFQPGSEVGQEILEWELFKNATDEDKRKRDAKVGELENKLCSRFKSEGIDKKLRERFNDELWGPYAEKCVLCGACNFVCPTCHCFTIEDETNLTGTEGRKVKAWDACHFKNFALIAGGLNFRGQRTSRVKLRIYDKLCYSMERHGVYSCVGCGRCTEFCPARIDIREIIEKVQKG